MTDRKAIFEAVKTEKDQFDRLDIAVSNAGYGHFSLMEEIPVETQRAQTEKNFFSSFHVIQAVLLFLREQNAGHII